MSEAKKRNMSIKGFLSKASKPNISASGFLAQHREWLNSSEVAASVRPILSKFDAEKQEAVVQAKDTEVIAQVALQEVSKAVLNHIFIVNTAKIAKAPKDSARKINKKWIATIYNSKSEIQTRITKDGDIKDLIAGFDKSGDADRWSDRQLIECSSDCLAVIEHSSLPIRTLILRADALARVLATKKGAVMAVHSQTTNSLGFKPHCKESKSSFSRG